MGCFNKKGAIARALVPPLYRVVFAALTALRRLHPPVTHGALVALWQGDRVVMVRNSYRQGLNFPGGGIRAGETPQQAAARELDEEVGIEVPAESLLPAGLIQCRHENRRDRVHMFELRDAAIPALRCDGLEVLWAHPMDVDEALGQHLTLPVRLYLLKCRQRTAPGQAFFRRREDWPRPSRRHRPYRPG